MTIALPWGNCQRLVTDFMDPGRAVKWGRNSVGQYILDQGVPPNSTGFASGQQRCNRQVCKGGSFSSGLQCNVDSKRNP
jgi:hypothetical protein